MATLILATKLYRPQLRPHLVPRSRLIERLNTGRRGKLTLISAPAGFGKTTLVSEWLTSCDTPIAWLSLDNSDNDPVRFLAYLITALQAIAPHVGKTALGMLQMPQASAIDAALTTLLNDLAAIPAPFILILDDYHVIAAKPVEQVMALLLEWLPTQGHLVIATREDPHLPLARLRAQGALTELRAADLRFTADEVAHFLTQVMGLGLAPDAIAALETRTEGWIAGLQLAAISLQGQPDAAAFITSFSGSHHFVLDYLVEEVLHQQPEHIQTFLLRTAILDRLCGPLCDAVVGDSAIPGHVMLEYIERANLFVTPLDDERHWYRYHHLFADLLRQCLRQSLATVPGGAEKGMAELHQRASTWYEANGLDLEAFHHAVAAHDVERAERLVDGKGISLHLQGSVLAILDWLGSLPQSIRDARPSLWVKYGSLLLVNGQTTGVEAKLHAAEVALHNAAPDNATRNLLGNIAAARATLALTRYDSATMITQSQCALEYLGPNKRSLRANAYWTLGYAYTYQGDRALARQALMEAVTLSQACGDIFTVILATTGLGYLQEVENQLHQAAETYQHILHLAGEQPLQVISEARLGLARICYEWNDLDAAERHGREALRLARHYESSIDRFIVSEVLLARIALARGDVTGASVQLGQTAQAARQRNFVLRLPEVAAAQGVLLLRQKHLAAAAQLAHHYDLPMSQARIALAKGNPAAALATLAPYLRQVTAKGWVDERLKAMMLQALALQAQGTVGQALKALGDALALAEPAGCIRSFIDEGRAMAHLVALAAAQGVMPDYTRKLLAAFATEPSADKPAPSATQPLIDPLSGRELEVLGLIAQGHSNREIADRLCVAVSTVKGHNLRIFGKLQVQRRTEAIARARELGLL